MDAGCESMPLMTRPTDPGSDSGRPALVGLDWGTSSLRAHGFGADGTLLETRTRPWGIRSLPDGGFAAALAGIAGDWLARQPAPPVVACGMVGSRQGWREAPYVACPADARALAAALVPCDTGSAPAGSPLWIVPGVARPGDRDARPERLPDVMRGEETQVCGALAVAPELADDALVVLPGTHSKWCAVRDGRLASFQTFMTGELFAVLRDHSLLGAPLTAPGMPGAAGPPGAASAGADAAARAVAPPEAAAHSVAAPPAAFLRGVRVARDAGAEGIAGRLFSTRTLFLADDLAAADVADHLSGLLVGDEIRAALAASWVPRGQAPVLVGDRALCARYAAAFAEFGVAGVRLLGDTAPAGLWAIARP
jgi:2-dehydro-3-deoxygalactonokinase